MLDTAWRQSGVGSSSVEQRGCTMPAEWTGLLEETPSATFERPQKSYWLPGGDEGSCKVLREEARVVCIRWFIVLLVVLSMSGAWAKDNPAGIRDLAWVEPPGTTRDDP